MPKADPATMMELPFPLSFILLIVLGKALLSICIYRTVFHPLAKYPGPFLAAVTDWYNVYHAWFGDRHIDILKLHEQYGDVVRYGPSRISINTDTALHQIYGQRCNVQKAQLYGIFESFFKVASSGSLIDKAKHGSRRRIVGQALTLPAIKSMEGIILNPVREWCGLLAPCDAHGDKTSLGDGWSAGRNMTEWIARLTVDIIGGLLFGQAWDAVEPERKKAFLAALAAGTEGFLLTGHMPGLVTLRLDRIFLRRMNRRARNFQATTKWQLDRRLAQYDEEKIKHDDLFEKLLTAQDTNTGLALTTADLHAESMTFMIAGSDTMATTMTATLFYLLHNPSTFEKLQDELQGKFSSTEVIVMGSELNSCVYLRACLDETMRLNPPVGGVLPREVLKGGVTIDGNYFPVGTDVGTSLYALQRQEKYFSDPLSFKPERWLANESLDNSTAWSPFSLGPRGCPAKTMAYAEMMVIMARIVFLFEMRLEAQSLEKGGEVNTEPRLFQTKDYFVSTHDGPVVQFKKRKL